VKYGLKPIKAAQSGAVIGMKCYFYYTFRREKKVGTKRKPTSNVQAWRPPFRYDNLELHLRGQQTTQWAGYNTLENDEKREAFFEERGEVFWNTIRSHFVSEAAGEIPLVVELDQSIVETIIGEMFFKPDDEGEEDIGQDDAIHDLAAELASVVARRREAAATTKKRALGIFNIH
jgi:hypothetical protein